MPSEASIDTAASDRRSDGRGSFSRNRQRFRRVRHRLKCVITALAPIAGLLVIGCGMSSPEGSSTVVIEWAHTSGDIGGRRFSESAQITSRNVGELREAWRTRIGDFDSSNACIGCARNGWRAEATPLMRGGLVYAVSPRGRVVALEATSGRLQWTFDPNVNGSIRYREGFTSRGLSLWSDESATDSRHCAERVFLTTVDARLIALDRLTGSRCGRFGVDGEIDLLVGVSFDGRRADPTLYSVTSPPLVVGDLVVVGSTVDGHATVPQNSAAVRAFDARSGVLRWQFSALGNSEIGDTRGRRSIGGGNVWGLMSADEQLGLIFLPTASASPNHFGGDRPGNNAMANSLVALRARDGRVAWHYQLVRHDLWDYDVASQPVLFQLDTDHSAVPVVVALAKSGTVVALDRRNGRRLFDLGSQSVPRSDVEGERASATQVRGDFDGVFQYDPKFADSIFALSSLDRADCARIRGAVRFEGTYTPPSLSGSLLFPGVWGGPNWDGAAWDDVNGQLLVPVRRLGTVVQLVPGSDFERLGAPTPGEQRFVDASGSFGYRRIPYIARSGIPCSSPPWSEVVAIRIGRTAQLWRRTIGTVPSLSGFRAAGQWGSLAFGGILTTRGGLAFVAATQDDRIRAFESSSGRQLWEDRLPAGGQSAPMSYEINGRQFIAILAGGRSGIGSPGDWIVAYSIGGR